MSDLSALRRFYAEEIQIASNVKSASLVEALAAVPRERFLPPGPWTIRGEADFQASPRQTPDADPRHVYHNVAIAIDPARTLFNGAPGLLAMAIDSLGLRSGDRVLHVGTGTGYYTALMALCVGAAGRVVGLEVDAALAAHTRENLAGYRWVEARHGNGAELDETFDAILVNAGVTHPLPAWLDALAPDGRMIVPLTATAAAMTTIGKGPLVLITNTGGRGRLPARIVGFVAIYSAIGLRDDAINTTLGQTMAKAPYAPVKWLRRDPHEPQPSCWIHTPAYCLSLE